MVRLPEVGGDKGTWGEILNTFLTQAHQGDGTLKTDSVGAPQLKPLSVTNAAIADGTIQLAKLSPAVQAQLTADLPDGAVTTTKIADDAVTPDKLAGLGAPDGIATLDATGKLTGNQIPTALLAQAQTARMQALANTLLASPISLTRPLSTETITVTDAAAATLTGRRLPVRVGGSGVIREIGSRGLWDATLHRSKAGSSCTVPGVEFVLHGDSFEVVFTAAAATTSYLLEIDGHPTTGAFQSVATTTGSGRYLKVVFASSSVRRIALYLDTPTAINGVTVPLTALVDAAPRRPVIAFVSDSYMGGSSGSRTSESFAWWVCRALGAEFGGSAIGGSGYISGGSASKKWGEESRVATTARFTPDLIVFAGTGNDSLYTPAQIQTAAADTYAAYAAACPGVPQIVVGPMAASATYTISSTTSAIISAIKSAADAAPSVVKFFDAIGTATGVPAAWAAGYYAAGARVTHLGSVWEADFAGGTDSRNWTPGNSTNNDMWRRVTWGYDGTGRVGATTGDGNRDVCLYTDTTHPTPTGQVALALPMLEAFTELLRSYLRPAG